MAKRRSDLRVGESAEGRAWRTIGDRLLNEGRIITGLCAEIDRLRGSIPGPWFDSHIAFRMEARLRVHRIAWSAGSPALSSAYVYKVLSMNLKEVVDVGRGKYHEERAMACYWMALEADEDAELLAEVGP